MDIVIHVSNFHYHNKGGIIQSINFGTPYAVLNEKHFNENMQLLVCIILLLHMLYIVILHFVGHRQKKLFYFAGIILFALIVTLMDDDRMLLSFSVFFYAYVTTTLFFPISWLDYTSKIIAVFMISAIIIVPIISRQASGQVRKQLFPSYLPELPFRSIWHSADYSSPGLIKICHIILLILL